MFFYLVPGMSFLLDSASIVPPYAEFIYQSFLHAYFASASIVGIYVPPESC